MEFVDELVITSGFLLMYPGIPRPLKSQTPWKRRTFPKKVELLEISYFRDWAKYINTPYDAKPRARWRDRRHGSRKSSEAQVPQTTHSATDPGEMLRLDT